MSTKIINYGPAKTFVKPIFIFWIICFIIFGTKRYRQIVGTPMGTNCAPLAADFCFVMREIL